MYCHDMRISSSPQVQENLLNDFTTWTLPDFLTFRESSLIHNAKTKAKERIRDTGLLDVPDAEIQRKARDKSLPSTERNRYRTEEKARKLRNQSKRKNIYSFFVEGVIYAGIRRITGVTLQKY